jgi:hypothetical protein
MAAELQLHGFFVLIIKTHHIIMDKDCRVCPNCETICDRIREYETKEFYNGEWGTMIVYVLHCPKCEKKWKNNYIFNPNPI